ncbi:hypothetical protein IM700_020690 [Paenibacillus sp. DXFW5]|uniref:Uncharacterized protein n=2 Tax=Paenibacillus TaxID=44249 RepID=A0ABS2H9M0_9BACL|nr:hypothetical protein [Paenibacillus rhizolycopersici]MBM6998090.1 hypothetical protein [Paenibacillus rhizolycopersici]
MKLKAIVSFSLALFFVTSSSSAYAGSNITNIKEKIIVITDQIHEVEKRVQYKVSEDNAMNNFRNNYEISYNEEIPQDNFDAIVISWEKAESNMNILQNIISNGREVFVFGENLDSNKISKFTPSRITDQAREKESKEEMNEVINDKEESWNLIGYVDGEPKFFSNIQSYTYEGKKKALYEDVVLQEISQFGKDNAEDIASILSYGTDTIITSGYNLNSSLYRDDANGNSILRATLNADYILKRNTTEDQDPKYDYLYLRNNVELTSYSTVTSLETIDIDHSLKYPSSDNILDWGPDSTNNANGNSITVGLPWAVSWSFTPSNVSTDISVSGGQTSDSLHWSVYNEAFTGLRYSLGNPTRIQPGTAWASTGSLASINMDNSAKVKYGTTDYYLSIYKQIEYDY